MFILYFENCSEILLKKASLIFLPVSIKNETTFTSTIEKFHSQSQIILRLLFCNIFLYFIVYLRKWKFYIVISGEILFFCFLASIPLSFHSFSNKPSIFFSVHFSGRSRVHSTLRILSPQNPLSKPEIIQCILGPLISAFPVYLACQWV